MMRQTKVIAVLAGFVALAAFSEDAFARRRTYHPGLGRFTQRDPAGSAGKSPMARNLSASQFTQRDPVGTVSAAPAQPAMQRNLSSRSFTHRDPTARYADGMNLYQYVGAIESCKSNVHNENRIGNSVAWTNERSRDC